MKRPVPPLVGARFGDDWWQRGVIYQVYPRSFADSDGDGVGDLVGILDHLDHLGPDGLGIDAIWLSPIHPRLATTSATTSATMSASIRCSVPRTTSIGS